MVAKRLIPVLHVLEGRVVDPRTGTDLGSPAIWAQRLELEGADEILFRELGQGARWRVDWLEETARCLFLPILLEPAPGEPPEAAAALAEGADLVLVPAATIPSFQEDGLRSRLGATLEIRPGPDGAWPDLDALAPEGAGALVLDPGPGPLGAALDALCARAAHLSMPVLLHQADPAVAADALAHGADGILFPAALRTASAFKTLLAGAGVVLRP